MVNPFETIDARLSNLESLILDLKHETLPKLLKELEEPKRKLVGLEGLLEARPFIAKSKSTIYAWTSKGKIPHSKPYGKLCFDLDEVDEWFMSKRKLSSTDITIAIEKHLNDKHK